MPWSSFGPTADLPGRDEIRAAVAPLLALAPEMATVMVTKLETDGLALTDGTWRIVLDDPLSGP